MAPPVTSIYLGTQGNNDFWSGAKTIKIEAVGYYSTPVIGLNNDQGRLRLYGDDSIATVFLDTGLINLGLNLTNNLWKFEAFITCKSNYSGGYLFNAWGAFQRMEKYMVQYPLFKAIDTLAPSDFQAINYSWQWTNASTATLTVTNSLIQVFD